MAYVGAGIVDPEEVRERLSNDETSLYHGVDLLRRSVLDAGGQLGPLVCLYRRPILDEWAERGNVSLQELVSHIVVHELAHLKEKNHDKAFYQLCQHMEPDYLQLEFDFRLHLTI